MTDLKLLKDLFEDMDGIFHEAAIPSVPRSLKNPSVTNENNVSGTLNVLIGARDTGIKRVIFASSSSVYGDTPLLPKHEDMMPPRNPLMLYQNYAVNITAGFFQICMGYKLQPCVTSTSLVLGRILHLNILRLF